MIRNIVIVIFLVLISTSISDASVFFEIKPKLDPNRPPNKQERINFARALYKKFYEMNDAIPNLSPSQEKWLKSEELSENPYRKLKAHESDEHYLQDTKERLENILKALGIIINGLHKDQKHEVLYWLGVADGMIDFNLSLGIAELVNRNLVIFSDERFGNSDLMLWVFGKIGRSILSAVIAPYIMGQLPELK
jgi:hypothetical protein